MTRSVSAARIGMGLVVSAIMVAGPARADAVLMGSDYFETIQPTFFIVPPGYPPLSGLTLPVMGVPIGPGTTDTIVQRQGNCSLLLSSAGSSCTIPIELVALSLVTVAQSPAPFPLFFRESPTTASAGQMTMVSDGSGTGGTFSSFFDVFIDFSIDGGNSWIPFDWNDSNPGIDPLHLTQSGANWSTVESGLLVDGLVGDQSANRHTNKNTTDCPFFDRCFDFYLLDGGTVTEGDITATHTVKAASPIPEPGSLALVGLAIAALGIICINKPGATVV